MRLLKPVALRLGLLAAPLLALIPVVAAVPSVESTYEQFAHQYLGRGALDALATTLSPSERRRFRPLPLIRDAIPTLTYHGINDHGDEYSVSHRSFARQMEMLDRAGFETVSIETFVRWYRGERVELPARPILISFDDGRLDSFRGADKVLEKHGFRATMFVITGQTLRQNPFHLYWDELREMQESGRWDLQMHAHDGHVRIRYDAAGHTGPFYTYRRYEGRGEQESLSDWRRRATRDVSRGERLLREEVPGFRRWSFALPYGNYGEDGNNDARIRAELPRWLGRRYAVVFNTNNPEYAVRPVRGRAPASVPRHELRNDTSASDVYEWLRLARPAKDPDSRSARGEGLGRFRPRRG
jgi:peptidoglycan/xylan/chitin deacetylase (PgdA/CDA1 family)